MKTNKATYERPTCDLLVVRFEQGILSYSDPNAVRSNSASSGYDANWDLDEI